MIQPTREDIGRRVMFVPPRGEAEWGVITGLNSAGVPWVRYDGTFTPKLTSPSDLEWDGSRPGPGTEQRQE